MLQDKICLVTGASRGIGREISRLLAGNGAQVILNYNSSATAAQKLADEIIAEGGKATTVKADVSSREEVDEMFKFIRKEFKRLDVLVNNAGILRDNLMLMTPDSDYDAIMDVNLKGTYNCMQRAAKMMMRKQSGKIINMASIIGRYGNAGQVVYGGTKAGVIGMTMSAAKELGPLGITVNAVAPGLIETEMIDQLKDEFKAKLIDNTALKRIGKPIDVARVVLFLSSELSDYVSGQTIGVDGCQVV
ncbi:MAG: 3-oxoacyl-ACP reductase FabG [Calditrichaeota bacterium]|nr:3-oxoacyl-ACP reductase FabG [Calditrichota bacterium]HQU74189.1 3-oxoacyl-ACP reductase family protein [Calditrichia bacterium]